MWFSCVGRRVGEGMVMLQIRAEGPFRYRKRSTYVLRVIEDQSKEKNKFSVIKLTVK